MSKNKNLKQSLVEAVLKEDNGFIEYFTYMVGYEKNELDGFIDDNESEYSFTGINNENLNGKITFKDNGYEISSLAFTDYSKSKIDEFKSIERNASTATKAISYLKELIDIDGQQIHFR